jgi:hypothetical protein
MEVKPAVVGGILIFFSDRQAYLGTIEAPVRAAS